LVCRSYLYQLFSVLFGSRPSTELLHVATSDDTIETLAYSCGNHPGISTLLDIHKKLHTYPDSTLDQITDEYTRLFVGPNVLCAPPWESAYASCDRTLFSETTLKVRSWYMKHGFLPATYPNESDDHLSFELDFMYRLSQQVEKLYHRGSKEEASRLLDEQHEFLVEHLLCWVERYSVDLTTSQTDFYPALSALLCVFLRWDEKFAF